MNTELKNALTAAKAKAQYDEKVKRLLGNRIILAHILVKSEKPGEKRLEKHRERPD